MPPKVLSYNIGQGGAGHLPELATVIRGQQPDAAALLEIRHRETAEFLARNLHMDLAFGEANNGYHIAWLSRLPMQRIENHRRRGLAKTLLEGEVVWAATPIHLFATHLGSRWDVPQPVDEIPVILGVLGPLRDRSHLLVGDLNALRPGDTVGTPPHGVEKRGEAVDGVPREAILSLLAAGYIDCYRARHPRSAGYTYPAQAPWLRIDYAFASPRMATHLAACDVVRRFGAERASDHLPVLATFHETGAPNADAAAPITDSR